MSGLIIDEMQGSGNISIGQDGMTGTRICRAHWANWPTAVLSLLGTPVVHGGFVMLVGRGEWPGIPLLKVQSVDVVGQGKMLKSNWASGPRYDFAKLTVNYGIDTKEDSENPETGEQGAYLIESLDYSVEIATVPVLVVDKTDKAKAQKTADELYIEQSTPQTQYAEPAEPEKKKKTLKRHIRIPTITYTTTLPRIPILPNKQINDALGKTNTVKIFGGEPGTVLFDGPEAERESVLFTQRFWRVTYKFLYNQFGWNNILHPQTLKWVPSKGTDSDNDPYLGYDLRKLFPAPYKVR